MCLRDRNAEERLEANKLYPPLPGAAPAVESQNAALCAAPPLEPAESAAPLGLGRVSAASAETDDAVGELEDQLYKVGRTSVGFLIGWQWKQRREFHMVIGVQFLQRRTAWTG